MPASPFGKRVTQALFVYHQLQEQQRKGQLSNGLSLPEAIRRIRIGRKELTPSKVIDLRRVLRKAGLCQTPRAVGRMSPNASITIVQVDDAKATELLTQACRSLDHREPKSTTRQGSTTVAQQPPASATPPTRVVRPQFMAPTGPEHSSDYALGQPQPKARQTLQPAALAADDDLEFASLSELNALRDRVRALEGDNRRLLETVKELEERDGLIERYAAVLQGRDETVLALIDRLLTAFTEQVNGLRGELAQRDRVVREGVLRGMTREILELMEPVLDRPNPLRQLLTTLTDRKLTWPARARQVMRLR